MSDFNKILHQQFANDTNNMQHRIANKLQNFSKICQQLQKL